MTTETYTDAQAIDEAVLLLTRKLRRLHSDIYADLMGCLPRHELHPGTEAPPTPSEEM